MENNRVDDYQNKRVEFYDSNAIYGDYYQRITVIIEYELLLGMLKTCPHTDEFKLLLSLLKAVKKSDELERQLEEEVPVYKTIEMAEPWSQETGWKDNNVGFLVHDSQGKCKKLSLWISYELMLDMVFSYGDTSIIRELKNSHMTEILRKKFLDKLNSL